LAADVDKGRRWMSVIASLKGGLLGALPREIRTPEAKWAYGFVSRPIDRSMGRAVKVVVSGEAGVVGVALVSTDEKRILTKENTVSAGTAGKPFYLEIPDEPALLMFRTHDTDDAGLVMVESVEFLNPSDRDMVTIRGMAEFPHWYYEFDLGEGITTPLNHPDPKGAMAAQRSALAVFRHIIAAHFGPLSGARVLDIACSAGFHVFDYAKAGAEVVAFDHDVNGIKQARFVLSCIRDQMPVAPIFLEGDLYDFDAKPFGGFDLILSGGLFYHLRDPLRGAVQLRELTNDLAIVQSFVSPSAEAIFEPTIPNKYYFIAPWEFALVPTASMLRWMWEKAGFEIVAEYREDGFTINSGQAVYDASRVEPEGVNISAVFHVLRKKPL
jgi:SAM-dependent methyltransferase